MTFQEQPNYVTISEGVSFIKTLSDNHNIRATVNGSVAGGIIVGSIAAASSLILGPVGLLLGGIFGGLIGYSIAKDKYKPLSSVIEEMTPQQKEKLRNHLIVLMHSVDVRDLITLAALIASNTSIKGKILAGIINFIVQEFGVQLQN
ncbi:protein C19orf12 homolog isoform X2 [Centruroides sculpturatus]|uniref:protein C19orf12 homolog isoform X2 n=1 Tax=Centruroides sculpturatus TaxID=218467 RepID=UPI000C6CF059|nr:protein C19orf12 homolog isoform X2 [Centruroides sculpturatus]